MKLKSLITAALLVFALPVMADGTVVQQAYEVAASDMRLPRAEGGTIAFKECDMCEYKRMRVGADTQYRINGQAVPLAKFRVALSQTSDPDNKAVTILQDLERNQVAAVSVNL